MPSETHRESALDLHRVGESVPDLNHAGGSAPEVPRAGESVPDPHRPRESAPETHLFIAGCPRSGTSAAVFLLNEHPQVALGFERFKHTRALLDPFHFTPAQFFAPVLAETDIRGELLYARLRARWSSGAVAVVGDKVPLYWRVLPELLERFPRGRLVLLVRELGDVAASFDRRARDPEDWWPAENDRTLAVRMWNEALQRARAAEQAGFGERILLLPYEPLLAGEQRWLQALLAFIGLAPTTEVAAEHRRLAQRWSERRAEPVAPTLAAYVDAHRDPELEAWARARMARQLELVPAPGGGNGWWPVPATEFAGGNPGEREAEREQLLAEMRRPGRRAADEPEALEHRLLEHSRELLRRGARLRHGAPSSAEERPGVGARVTFILPHQRPTTGGVYAIEQFASHLARELEVSALVRDAASRPIAGVGVRSVAQLDAEALPDADVLVYPADMADAARLFELPEQVGRPVMLIQGYGTPGSPIVRANLERGGEAVAIAHWLVEDALRHGTACTYVPLGLDRALFHPGPSAGERPPRVSLMSHHLDWKGPQDALEAISLVRAVRADVEVVCFGVEPIADADRFLASPTRAQVAALQRSCAVHLVASWEEGFGMTGAEALACGAALATTDTKGSRDYAIDGATALLSAPRDPRALADNVLRLLGDAPLRARLAAAGQRHLRGVMPPWSEAARRLAAAIA
jgi:glycosyltransferase involved in cell wall biosynthesis